MNVNEKTQVPVVWLFSAISILVTVGVFASGIIVWGTRLEAREDINRNSVQEARVVTSDIQVKQAKYAEDIGQIKQDMVELKTMMKQLTKGN